MRRPVPEVSFAARLPDLVTALGIISLRNSGVQTPPRTPTPHSFQASPGSMGLTSRVQWRPPFELGVEGAAYMRPCPALGSGRGSNEMGVGLEALPPPLLRGLTHPCCSLAASFLLD